MSGSKRIAARMGGGAAKDIVPGIAVIGLGNWGSSLAYALRSMEPPVLREVIHASPAATIAHRGKKGAGLYAVRLADARLDASVLWLCVPDSQIAQVAHRLVQRVAGRPRGLRGQVVVHSSGALNVSVLEEAERAGASIASIHPVMTFPSRTPVPLAGIPFGVEAGGGARRVLYRTIRQMGGEPFAIASSNKPLYHAASLFASPLLVSLIAAASDLARLSGVSDAHSRGMIQSIAAATLKNIRERGLKGSFSGPLARGDAETIHLHLAALRSHPALAAAYSSLGLYALESLPSRNAKELRGLLHSSSPLGGRIAAGRSRRP